MISVSGPDLALALAIIGVVLMLFSIAPTPFKADLRYVGMVFLIIGVIAYVLLLLLG